MQLHDAFLFSTNFRSSYIYSLSKSVDVSEKKATNAMSERRQAGSISRTLLLPREHHHLGSSPLGTFRLRHILAEDGCKESQVALAKSLLTAPAKDSEERAFNAQLAVYWLLQAAEKGHEESFLLLKDCAFSGVGINAINNYQVEKCLSYSEENKLSRRVAFSIYRAIMSETEDIIPEDLFKDKIDLLFKDETREKPTKPSDPPLVPLLTQEPMQPSLPKKSEEASLRNQAHVSFSEVVNSVQSCLEGNVPLVSLKQVTHYNEYKKWLSTKYIHMLWNLILHSAEKLFQNLSTLVLPLSLLFVFLFMCIAACFTSPANEMSHFLKVTMFFVAILFCLLSMVSTTCFVVHVNFGGDNVRQWLHLIKILEPNVRTNEIEKKYLSKTMIPLAAFFLISFIYISLVPFDSIPSVLADIGVLSFILMLFIDRTISHQRYYVNISFVLNALACLYKTNILQSLLVNSLSFLNFNITYEVFENIHVHISLISCLTLPFILPYLYVKMMLGKHKGWHLVLLPHLMSLVWMNLASTHLAHTTTCDQFLSLFSWLTVLVLSNYVGTAVTFVVYLLLKVALTLNYLRIEILLLCFVFFVLYIASSFVVRRFQVSHESKLWSSVLCLMVLLVSYQVIKPPTTTVEKPSSAILPWEKYQTFCHHNAWYRTNIAEVQISCLPLKGREVLMEGTVTGLDIIEIRNNVEFLANALPEPLRGWVVCGLGKNYVDCDAETLTQAEKERCRVYESLNINHCHLHNWDEYKYQIILEVSSRTSPEVVLLANHDSSTFVRSLKEGDSIQVIGALDSNIGTSSPKFLLRKATCSSCYSDIAYNPSSVLPLPGYKLSVKNIIWFYLAPFIQYEAK